MYAWQKVETLQARFNYVACAAGGLSSLQVVEHEDLSSCAIELDFQR